MRHALILSNKKVNAKENIEKWVLLAFVTKIEYDGLGRFMLF